jgi:hypothetical protein
MHARAEIYQASWREYEKAGKKERSEILDRLVATIGINRDYLTTRLRSYSENKAAESAGKGKQRKARRPGGKRGGAS